MDRIPQAMFNWKNKFAPRVEGSALAHRNMDDLFEDTEKLSESSLNFKVNILNIRFRCNLPKAN